MPTKTVTAAVLAGLTFIAGCASPETPAITAAQAIDLALAEVNGTVDEVSLERSRGVQYYSVNVVTVGGGEAEVEIDATTGEILDVEL